MIDTIHSLWLFLVLSNRFPIARTLQHVLTQNIPRVNF